MDKQEIRRQVRQRIKLLSAQQRECAAERIFGRVEAMDSFHQAECVALFASMGDEVPTDGALAKWYGHKRVVVPRVEGDIMRFYDYTPESMQQGAYGIMEPMGESEVKVDAIDLIVVPARAFTAGGARLGRGGGFYDKYMSQPEFRAYKVGIAFDCQIFDELPIDSHDILVDEVVTER